MDRCSLRRLGQGVIELLSEKVLTHLTPVTSTFDQVTSKSRYIFCYPGLICGSLRKVGQFVFKLLIENGFDICYPDDLDLLIPKSIGYLCYQGWMRGPCLRTID